MVLVSEDNKILTVCSLIMQKNEMNTCVYSKILGFNIIAQLERRLNYTQFKMADSERRT